MRDRVRRARTIAFEKLEQRFCLFFQCYGFTGVGGALVFDGDHKWQYDFGIHPTGGTADHLTDLYVDPLTKKIYYSTFDEDFSDDDVDRYKGLDTHVTLPTTPFSIEIRGRLQNDSVSLGSLTGFPTGNAALITSLTFWGGDGDDTFIPPEGPGPGLAGAVQLPTSGQNIRFYGGSGNDTLTNKRDPELFVGGEGNDRAIGVGGGDDFLAGGTGNDILYGGEDADTILGGSGQDQLFGEEGEIGSLGTREVTSLREEMAMLLSRQGRVGP